MHFAAYTLLVATLLVANNVLAIRREYAIVTVKFENYETHGDVHLDLLADDRADLIRDLGAEEYGNGYRTTKSLVKTQNAFAKHGFEVLSTATSGVTLIYTLASTQR